MKLPAFSALHLVSLPFTIRHDVRRRLYCEIKHKILTPLTYSPKPFAPEQPLAVLAQQARLDENHPIKSFYTPRNLDADAFIGRNPSFTTFTVASGRGWQNAKDDCISRSINRVLFDNQIDVNPESYKIVGDHQTSGVWLDSNGRLDIHLFETIDRQHSLRWSKDQNDYLLQDPDSAST